MADTRVTDLAAITGANTANGDVFPIVDVSDTTMAASGTNKKITKAELLNVFEAAGTAASAVAAHEADTTNVHGIADTSALETTTGSASKVSTHAALTSGVHGISAFGATLVDDADASAARTTLGLVIGTNVQAQDAELAAIAGLTSAADRLPYFTGSGTASLATFTAAGRAILDDADATAQRATLGLGTIATQASSSVTITGGSISGITDLAVADGGTGASTAQAATANLRVAPATVTGTTDTLAAGDDATVILYTAAGAVTVTLANIATGFECVLVCLGAGGLSVAAGGMSFANSFTPKLTVAQGEALFVKQTAASTWIVLGGTAT